MVARVCSHNLTVLLNLLILMSDSGPVSQANGGGEAMLDITIAYELIYPQTVEIFSTDDLYYAESKSLP